MKKRLQEDDSLKKSKREKNKKPDRNTLKESKSAQ